MAAAVAAAVASGLHDYWKCSVLPSVRICLPCYLVLHLPGTFSTVTPCLNNSLPGKRFEGCGLPSLH